MTKLSGIVHLKKKDGSIGAPVSNADIIFESINGQENTARVRTDSNGKYEIEISSNEVFGAVEDSEFGPSQSWIKVVNLQSASSKTLNLFIPDIEQRLNSQISAYPGEFGIYALNLNSGKELSINADSLMYLASVSKIAIAIGCVDLMRSASDINKKIKLKLYHYREEGKLGRNGMGTQYQDLGEEVTIDLLFRRMLGMSDTSATDVLCEEFGISNINEKIKSLNISGIEEFSSMIQLDRRRWWLSDKNVGFLPQFAFSLYRRQRISYWLKELGLQKPSVISGNWERYLSERRDRATAKAYAELFKKIANKNLLRESWKNDLLLNTIIPYGGFGRFLGTVDISKFIIDSKGGSHHQVRNQAGIIRDKLTKTPLGVLVAFTQKNEVSGGKADKSLKAAGDLALKYIDIEEELQKETVKDGEIAFISPKSGLTFEIGETPFIKWTSKGVTGPLKLSLIKQNGTQVMNISNSVKNDGEWHSFQTPDNLTPDDTYQFKLTGKDSDDEEVEAISAFFTIDGTIHIIEPVTGSNLQPGSKPKIKWVSSGITGKLKIELKDQQNNSIEITSNAKDDGEWHSWEVPGRLDRKWGYYFRISSIEDPKIFDNSGLFSIGGKIDIISPKPYEIWKKGSRPKIQWKSEGVIGPLTIQLIGRNNVTTISTNANNDGEWHSWEVPDVESGQGYRIVVFETRSPEIKGFSDLFQIGTVHEWIVPSVEQSPVATWSPSGRPHYFKYNEETKLEWRRIGPEVGNLKIELLQNKRRVKLLSSSARDDGEWHSWKPETNLSKGSNYQFKISHPSSGYGLSAPFSIGANIDVSISILRPKLKDNPVIKWVSQNISGDLTIHIVSKDESENLISNVARDDGEWSSWTVTDDTPKGWARIRVRSNRFNDVFGYSEWFKI